MTSALARTGVIRPDPKDPSPLRIDEVLVRKMLVLFIRDEIAKARLRRAVVEDAVGRQVDLAVDVHELPARPVPLRDVELRVGRALDEPGADIKLARRLGDGQKLRIVGGARHVGGEIF